MANEEEVIKNIASALAGMTYEEKLSFLESFGLTFEDKKPVIPRNADAPSALHERNHSVKGVCAFMRDPSMTVKVALARSADADRVFRQGTKRVESVNKYFRPSIVRKKK